MMMFLLFLSMGWSLPLVNEMILSPKTQIFALTPLIRASMMKLNMETSQIMTLDSEQLRAAMRAWTSGVAVVAAAHEGQTHGMTVSSFTSISLEPPMITTSLQTGSRTHELIEASGGFGLTILSHEQTKISDIFAGRMKELEDRFTGLQTETLLTGSPLIVGGLAWMDCRLAQTVEIGMNTLLIAEVIAAKGTGEGKPLIYHNREYWELTKLP